MLGGFIGKGVDKIITDAYQWLVDTYNPGDEIFIFGFSRGAYTARSLAGFIAKCGLLKAGAALGVKQLYNRYRRADARTLWADAGCTDKRQTGDFTIEEQWMLKYSHCRPHQAGRRLGHGGRSRRAVAQLRRLQIWSNYHFMATGLRRPIDNGFHALAIDEHRLAFSPTLWTVRHSDHPDPDAPPPRPLSSVEQRWFVGAHANVGGGYESDMLPQIPLRWLMKKASLHGLAFRNDVEIDGDELTAPVDRFLRRLYVWHLLSVQPPNYRPIGAPPTPADSGTDSNVNETIDASVFARWNNSPSYRPPNLAAWAARYNVQMANLTNSVLATAPGSPAPD